MEAADLRLGHKLEAHRPEGEGSHASPTARRSHYQGLVSSVPLPELDAHDQGRAARRASRRRPSWPAPRSCIVNLVIDRPDLLDAHWTYIYDQDIFFTRLSTPHLQSPHNVPPGCGSIQAECYYSRKYRPLDRTPEECIEPTIRDLRRIGVLREDDKILFKDVDAHRVRQRDLRPRARRRARRSCTATSTTSGIAYCGRYGDWAYIWTDESFMSGENAAEKVLRRA